MALAIANRYASALAEVVTKPGSSVDAATTLEELRAFQGLIDESTALRNVMVSPAVTPVSKRNLIGALCERTGVSKTTRNFLYVVVDHRRAGMLDEMIAAYQAWLDDSQGVARLRVFSASELDAGQRQALVDKFAQITGRKAEAEFEVDKELLGGAVVRHGSTVYDGSLRAQLAALDRAVSGES